METVVEICFLYLGCVSDKNKTLFVVFFQGFYLFFTSAIVYVVEFDHPSILHSSYSLTSAKYCCFIKYGLHHIYNKKVKNFCERKEIKQIPYSKWMSQSFELIKKARCKLHFFNNVLFYSIDKMVSEVDLSIER